MTLSILKGFYFIVFSVLAGAINSAPGDLEQASLSSRACNHPPYTVHIFSKSPLVIYISNFLSTEERSHLQYITEGTFTNSTVADGTGAQGIRQTRNSQSTTIPRDAIVRCIESRALAFQGFDVPRTHLEPLQLVQYSRGGTYHWHTDWFESAAQTTTAAGGNRLTSFFVYVAAANITGGGTNFPVLNAPSDELWCDYVDCDESWENGVTFRPVPGNAVFWQNLREDGSGDPATLHAGMPVTSGAKLGMNIWTRQRPLSVELRGTDLEEGN